MTNFYIDGLGETLGGSDIAQLLPLQAGAIWYVNSATGTDSGTTARGKERPFASLAYVLPYTGDGDIVVLESGHSEDITAAVSVSGQKVLVVGIGTSSGLPSASLRMAGAGGTIACSPWCTFVNIRFKASTAASSGTGFITATTGSIFDGCRFEPGQYDTLEMVNLDGAAVYHRFHNCTFVAQHANAVSPVCWDNPAGLTATVIEVGSCTFDGGTTGFNGYAFDTTGATPGSTGGQVALMTITNTSLLRGADIGINASTVARVQIASSSGSGKVAFV